MAVALRLMRLGKKHRPFYRIVAIDKRKKRNSRYIESVGSYNPLSEPTLIEMDWARFEDWKQKGAIISEGLLRLLKTRKNIKKDLPSLDKTQ